MSKEEQLTPRSDARPRVGDEALDFELQINLRFKLDEVAEIEATALRVNARREPSSTELVELAGRIYDARRTRAKVLDGELFGEPAWDMLLALYCLPRRGLIMSVSGLNYSAEVPQTTGLRWQKLLRDEGLIERGPQEVDARRQIVRLTDKGRALMTAYLTRLFYCGAPVPPQRPLTKDD
jgi:DNA-binding MarR family transcriptional regulator